MEHLQTFISECDRKTEMYKRRLKETQEELSEEANSKVKTIYIVPYIVGVCICTSNFGVCIYTSNF